MATSFPIQCSCGRILVATNDQIGTVVQCDQCDSLLRVPRPLAGTTFTTHSQPVSRRRREATRQRKTMWLIAAIVFIQVGVLLIVLLSNLSDDPPPESPVVEARAQQQQPWWEESISANPQSNQPVSKRGNDLVEPTPVGTTQVVSYSNTILPFINRYCSKCHGPAKQTSELRLDTLDPQMSDAETLHAWQEVVDRMNVDEMPPAKSLQPDPEERQRFIHWLDERLRIARQRIGSNDGQVVLRRLNRAEYANTIRDLFGIAFDANTAVFPDDAEAFGFDTIGSELVMSPALLRKYLQAAQKIVDLVVSKDGRRSPRFTRVFGFLPRKPSVEHIRKLLRRFATRAFRRPVTQEKLDRLVDLVRQKRKSGGTTEQGIKQAVTAVLCSPQFVYMTEKKGKLNGYALATRLSYFLWSSMPDDELFRLAGNGELHQPSVLEQQTLRMLKSSKSRAFVQRFSGQWLRTRDVGVMQPDKALFPRYDVALEEAMRGETEMFFAEILHNNLSVLNFIDSDFAMLNDRLARHYGIRGVKGAEFRRVELHSSYHRGGVLGHASVLSITSDGVRSSPVVRGVWVLTNLLGSPPAPPPANVPDLEPDTRGAKTIRDELARHRTIESCNSCHRKIDPLGFALENYDAVGQWRTHYLPATKTKGKGTLKEVDASGLMSNGERFENVSQFKQRLMARKQEFCRCLTEKLLTYAIGRGIDGTDRGTIDKLVSQLASNDYAFRQLVINIVQSDLFQTK